MIRFLDQDFTTLNDWIEDLRPSQLLILVDQNTHHHCLPTLLGNLRTEIPFEIIEIEAGEELKNLDSALQLWEILAEFHTDRKALLINLGGGVISDLGGFVASTYKRGIPFIHIPTTLLSMCDASIGGKTGIDFQFYKNLIGTFEFPKAIFVYPEFLETLPEEQILSGLAEMLKHGLILDSKHWEHLTTLPKYNAKSLAPLIQRSMELKQSVVEKDFKEQNLRKALNFGHTVGHAIESLYLKSGMEVTHGHCVAIGMVIETQLSLARGVLEASQAYSIQQKLLSLYPVLPIESFSNESLLEIMRHDKKNEALENINFTLLCEIGNSLVNQGVSESEILLVLDTYRAL
ncbi:3-dehydroquinate synthase [Chryseobacterium sp. A301]